MQIGPQGRSWTFLYYLNGDNNLREEVSLDFVRVHEAGAPKDTAVVAQLYRGEERWTSKNLGNKLSRLTQKQLPPAFAEDWRGSRTFVVGQGPRSSEQVPGPEVVSPSDPQSLTNFVRWGMREFPADNYALVVSSHGQGEDGLLRDGNGTLMPLPQFRSALAAAEQQTGQKLNLLVLQACLMGQPAAAAALAGSAEYVLASPEKIPAAKARHDHLLQRLDEQTDKSPPAVAQTVRDTLAETLPGMTIVS
jgi:hypothetical protein